MGLLATGRRRLLKYPIPPAFSFVLPSFPCLFAFISCISCLFFICSRTLFFGSGATVGKSLRFVRFAISMRLGYFQSLSLSLFLSSFFLSSHAPRFPSFKHRAQLSPYRHLNGWGLLFLFHNERTISSFDEKSISLEGLEGFHGVFFSYF